jgi:hypothetical protein
MIRQRVELLCLRAQDGAPFTPLVRYRGTYSERLDDSRLDVLSDDPRRPARIDIHAPKVGHTYRTLHPTTPADGTILYVQAWFEVLEVTNADP